MTMPGRQSFRRRRRQTPLVVALYLNAGLLACVLTALLARNGSSSAAFAALPDGAQPVAGGNGLYLMPGQFAVNIWGCYVMDVERQTLCAYEYIPGRKQLQLVASRYFGHDRRLRSYNTSPDPEEIERLANLQDAPIRGQNNNDARPAPAVNDGGNEPATRPVGPNPGERPLDRPAQPGDPDFVPKPSDINDPPR